MAGQPPQGQGGYPPPPSGNGPQGHPYGQPYRPQGNPQQAYDPKAPFGVDRNGVPYSDKSKLVVVLLQLLPFIIGIGGIGRLYMGDTGKGIAQLVLSFVFVGSIWSIIDGIIMLTSENVCDPDGLPLRPMDKVHI